MVMVNDRRRYVEANRPARLTFRLTLAELHDYAIEDLTPPHGLPIMEAAWARLLDSGSVAGRSYEVAVPAGRFDVTYCGLAEALPGLHLIAFAPAGWPDDELCLLDYEATEPPLAPLTAREQQVLQLAARGFSGPRIAQRLVVSPSTVKTHFANIYKKLAVRDRTTAVANGMRLGLVD
jgi:DNA-binding CsgD family transcriptional regulator